MDNRYLFRGKTIEGVRPHFVTGHYVSTPRPMIVSDKPKIGGGWAPGRYAWEFANMKMLDEPIPAKGGQRIWNWGGE